MNRVPYFLILSMFLLCGRAVAQSPDKAAGQQYKGISPAIPNATITGKSYALVVGISNYSDMDLHIEKCSNDAEAFYDFFKSEYNSFPISERGIIKLIDNQAKKKNIEEALDYLCKNAEPNSTLYFYYSGHADSFSICPYDLNKRRDDTKLEYSTIITKINNSNKFKHKVIILDACYSGSIVSILGNDGSTESAGTVHNATWDDLKIARKGYVVFASSQKYEKSIQDESGALFTKFMLSALKCADGKCADANGDSVITARELADYLLNIKETSAHPLFKGDGSFQMSVLNRHLNHYLEDTFRVTALSNETEARLRNLQEIHFSDKCYSKHLYGDAVEGYLKNRSFLTDTQVFRLAECYLHVNNAPQAIILYNSEIRKGNSTAMILMGDCFKKGVGEPQDYAKAIEWYTKAAKANDPNGMLAAAIVYDSSIGNYEAARGWYEMAAEAGNVEAMKNLGIMYVTGKLGADRPDRFEIAKKWLMMAANDGTNSSAMKTIGDIYRYGLGTELFDTQAMIWYKKATELENNDAKRTMDNMTNRW